MTRAESLVQLESKLQQRRAAALSSSIRDARAIEVYTQLMESLIDGRPTSYKQNSSSDEHLLKVFLVFQEMKAVGAKPDLACFNALLRACMRCGDVDRAQDVMRQMELAGLEPNDTSWRHLIKAAAQARDSQRALAVWKQGISWSHRSRNKIDEPIMLWKPSTESFSALIQSFLYEASSASTEEKVLLYENVVRLYDLLLLGDEELGLNRMDPNQVLDNHRTMLVILQALVSLEELYEDSKKRGDTRRIASSILQLECFHGIQNNLPPGTAANTLRKALSW
jgi:pentatricopeptide repeat protein